MDQCCGFGGTFAVKYPEISGSMVRDKVECIRRSGAETQGDQRRSDRPHLAATFFAFLPRVRSASRSSVPSRASATASA